MLVYGGLGLILHCLFAFLGEVSEVIITLFFYGFDFVHLGIDLISN